jgi:hypothetical protein
LVEAGGDLPEAVVGSVRAAAAQRGERAKNCREDGCSYGSHSLTTVGEKCRGRRSSGGRSRFPRVRRRDRP